MTQLSLVEPQTPSDIDTRLEDIAKGVETIQATAIIKIGERLAEARDLFRYDRREGGFTGWCERRLGIGKDAAYRMISVFETMRESVGNCQHFAELSKRALMDLAAPSTPEAVRKEVERLLVDGQKVTAADVRRLKEQALSATEIADELRAQARAASEAAEGLRAKAEAEARRAAQLELRIKQQASAAPVDVDAVKEEIERKVRGEVHVGG